MKIDELNTKRELVKIATDIIKDKVNILEGCIAIDELIDINKKDQKFLIPIKGFLSEAEDFFIPVSSSNALQKSKKTEIEFKKYISEEKPFIYEICNEIIKKYSREIKQFESSIYKILSQNDPVTLYFKDLGGKYTYETEMKLILKKLDQCQSEEQIEDMVRYIFVDLYGDVARENKKVFKNIGTEIWSLIN